MSHELRTPLAAILGYAELMQEGFYGNQSEKSMDALARIRSNGKHLLGLINTVLDIAKNRIRPIHSQHGRVCHRERHRNRALRNRIASAEQEAGAQDRCLQIIADRPWRR